MTVSWQRSLRTRLLLGALLIVLLAIGTQAYVGMKRMEVTLTNQLQEHVAALASAYRSAVLPPLVMRDYATLREMLVQWHTASKQLTYLAVTNEQGHSLAAVGVDLDAPLPTPTPTFVVGDAWHIDFPVEIESHTYGHLRVGLSTEFIATARWALLRDTLAVALTASLLAALALLLTTWWLTRHLRLLTAAAERIGAGQYDITLPVDAQDEIGILAQRFAQMAEAVRARVAELDYLARHDPLTDLPNRRAFEEFLHEALRWRGDQPLYLLYLDLDQFKAVNDSCGHAAGDRLLQNLAAVMRERFGADYLARLGGDEFAIVLRGGTIETAHARAQAMIEEIDALPFLWEEKAFQLGASIGLAAASDSLHTVEALLIAADTACYAAKELGRNRVEVFSPGERYFQERQKELAALSTLTAALRAEDRLVLYHQRIEPLNGGQAHAEILVRLHDDSGRIVSPGEFLPAAERYGLITFLDRWVIDHALAKIRQRLDVDSCRLHHINLNLSGASLADETFVHFLAERLAHYRVDPRRLCFEITESQAIANLAGAAALIDFVHRQGATVALDDFGSGLSSFGYLKRFPVDYLKIDGQFVRQVHIDPRDHATVQAIVALARAHRLKTVAEFVSANEMIPVLRELGVDYAQGYAIHQPEPW